MGKDSDTAMVFNILEEYKSNLVNRMLLANFQEQQELYLSPKKLQAPITDFDFFKKNEYLYWMISEGVFLSLSHLSSSKEIIAIRKSPSLDGTHEVIIYQPSN